MADRNFEQEGAEHRRRQTRADTKIRDQEARIRSNGFTCQQEANELRLVDFMRGNKASLDLNRAMFDYDDAHKGEKRGNRIDLSDQKQDADDKP